MSVVWVIALSIFLIKTRYKLVHYIAMIICTVGMIVLIFEDSSSHNELNKGHQVFGDLLCIISALAQSIGLVGEEFLIKEEISIIDYLAMLGFGGAVASSIQL